MESISELKAIVQKQKRKKQFLLSIGYLWHRNISIYITYIVIRFFPFIKPNHISWLMLLVLIAGSIVLIHTDGLYQLIGIVMIYMSFLLDKVDGELARYKEIYSIRGVFLDQYYHVLGPVLLMIPLVWELDIVFYTQYIIVFIVCSIFARYNRKLIDIITIKMSNKIQANEITISKKSSFVHFVCNIFVFRLFSIVERFDIMIFLLCVSVLVQGVSDYVVLPYVFIGYTIAYMIYVLRWFLLYYFGSMEEIVLDKGKSLFDSPHI